MAKFIFKSEKVISSALMEDIGKGDITTNTVIPENSRSTAKIIVKEPGILCGIDIAHKVFRSVNKKISFVKKVKDGAKVKDGTIIAVVKGPSRSILTAERTVLNFLQRLSGIATLTNEYVKAAGKKVKILDTRKTTPGLRLLEKYAVKVGGGINHRFGLYDAVLIKDNHIEVVGGLRKAAVAARKKYINIEVEVKTFKQVKEAVGSGATRIMLDNMTIAGIKKAVKLIRRAGRKIEIEASGGVKFNNICNIAKTGVDFISVGALTHSAPALDISLKIAK